jgi:hypothetical protein
MDHRPVRTVASIALVVCAARAFAAEQVDLQIRPKERVLGTIYPKDDVETFLVEAPRSARITARAWRTGRLKSTPTLALMNGTAVVQPGVPDSTGAGLKSFSVDASAAYGLRVQSDGAFDGDYQFKVSIAPKKTWSQKAGASVDAGAEATFDFAAPSGAAIDVALTPAKGSSFVPLITEIDGPDGFVLPVDATGATPVRHRIRGVVLDTGGDYTVRFVNASADAAGAYAIVVHVVPPRLAKSDPIDIRDESLVNSRFDADSRVYGRVVDSSGGRLVDSGDTTSELAGMSITVPADAVPSPQIFAFESSDDISGSSGADPQPAGPSVKLLPEHTTFDKTLTVTIPYDPESFDDPTNEVRVNTEDPVTHEPVPVAGPFVVDRFAHTVSYPSSHFSRFQAASTLPRPVKGSFVELDLSGSVSAAGGVAGGSATLSLSLVDALKGRISGNGFHRTLPRRSIVWDQSSAGWSEVAPPAGNGVITVADDENVTLSDAVDGAVQYTRGRNPDVLIHRPAAGAANAAVSVLLRRTKGAPTVSNVAGDWNAFVLEASAQFFTGADAYKGLNLSMGGQVAQLTFGLDGSATARTSVRFGAIADDAADHDGSGRWLFSNVGGRGLPKPGTLAFPADGSNVVQLTMQLGTRILQATTVTLFPVLRGEMLVGVADNSAATGNVGPLERLVVLVRARQDASSRHLLVGDSAFAAFGLVAADFAGPPASQDVSFVANDFVATHDVASTATYAGRRDVFARDALGAPSTNSDPTFSVSGPYSVAADGSYVMKALQLTGAVTVRPNVFVTTRFVKGALTVGFGVLKRPPN